MYYPESCPFLRQIQLNDFVEWDILFLMLERRNFGLVGIQRIQTLTLPFVPFEYCQYLSCLLEGRLEPLEKPSSLEVTRDLIFDPNV